jgi:hypothetical protein
MLMRVALLTNAIDDSGSMTNRIGKAEERWKNQKDLALRIARDTTLILPDNEGVAFHFINKITNDSPSLNLKDIERVLDSVSPTGDTAIGTTLRERILKPLVYDPLEAGTLRRPLLVSILTDGAPYGEAKRPGQEDEDVLASVIVECGDQLAKKGKPRDCEFSVLPWIYTVLSEFGLLRMVCSREILDRPDRVGEGRCHILEDAREDTQGQPGDCQRVACICGYVNL